jgi:hypothetical protein
MASKKCKWESTWPNYWLTLGSRRGNPKSGDTYGECYITPEHKGHGWAWYCEKIRVAPHSDRVIWKRMGRARRIQTAKRLACHAARGRSDA